MSFKRYTLTDVTSNQFYQMPKFLFEGELKKSLSNDARVLYSLLRDRHNLSLSNKWVDKNGDVYIIFTRAEMGEMLSCSKQKITNICNELKKHNLFEEERQGLNKPNLIYLNYLDYEKNFFKPDETENKPQQSPPNKEVYNLDFQKSKNHTSRGLENRLQEVPKLDTNKTNINKTDFSNTNINHPIFSEQKNCHDIDCDTEDIETLTEIIKENICYEIAKQTQGETEYIDNILDIMLEVLTSKSPTVRIGGEEKPRALIKSIFMKLTYDHISYVCLCLSESTSKIKYIKQYLLTALYNAPKTMDIYYTQRVKHDMNL